MNGGYSMIESAEINFSRIESLFKQGKPIVVYEGASASPGVITKTGSTYIIRTTNSTYTVTADGVSVEVADAKSFNYAAETGVKNLFNYDEWKSVNIARGTAVAGDNSYALTSTGNDCYTEYNPAATNPYPSAAKIPVRSGERYLFTCSCASLTEGKTYRVTLYKNGVASSVLADTKNVSDTSVSLSFTAPSDCEFVTFRFNLAQTGTTATFKDIMCRNASISDSTYSPWTPTNAELYAMILALQE